MLRYDVVAEKYIGWYGRQPVQVDAGMFEAAVAMLCCEGMAETEARTRLLNVAEWIDAADEPVAPTCLACGADVQPGRLFCGVVCEAARVLSRLPLGEARRAEQQLPLA